MRITKKTVVLIVIVLVISLGAVAAFVSTQRNPPASGGSTMDSSNKPAVSDKTLILYLSRTGNTEAVARMIQAEVGGTVTELELENPYPEDYQAHVAQVDDENERDYLPPLKTSIGNLDNYETIFIGAPTWDMQLPPPMKSFLSSNDLDGKTIVPFNTNGGYGVGSSFEDVKARCTGCNVLKGFTVEGGRERDGILFVMKDNKEVEVKNQVRDWLTELNLTGNTN